MFIATLRYLFKRFMKLFRKSRSYTYERFYGYPSHYDKFKHQKIYSIDVSNNNVLIKKAMLDKGFAELETKLLEPGEKNEVLEKLAQFKTEVFKKLDEFDIFLRPFEKGEELTENLKNS